MKFYDKGGVGKWSGWWGWLARPGMAMAWHSHSHKSEFLNGICIHSIPTGKQKRRRGATFSLSFHFLAFFCLNWVTWPDRSKLHYDGKEVDHDQMGYDSLRGDWEGRLEMAFLRFIPHNQSA
jgi:hypothetical protein